MREIIYPTDSDIMNNPSDVRRMRGPLTAIGVVMLDTADIRGNPVFDRPMDGLGHFGRELAALTVAQRQGGRVALRPRIEAAEAGFLAAFQAAQQAGLAVRWGWIVEDDGQPAADGEDGLTYRLVLEVRILHRAAA